MNVACYDCGPVGVGSCLYAQVFIYNSFMTYTTLEIYVLLAASLYIQ